MPLDINPESLCANTIDGHTMTLLSLALSTATANHPNHKLIDAIREKVCSRQEQLFPETVSRDDTELSDRDDAPMPFGKYKLLTRGRTFNLE